MMKTPSLFIACIIYLNISAQNVGIGTTTPAQKLDIVGNLKVSGAIMPGGIAGATGEVLTSTGAGTAPAWESPKLALPYFDNATSVASLFTLVQNGSGAIINLGIANPSNPNPAINASTGGTGFAGQIYSTNVIPKALKTFGGLQLAGIGEGAGKILTSDVNGNATWNGPVAFMGYINNNLAISNNTSIGFGVYAEALDEGNNFSAGFLFAPQNGIYHFDVSVKWGSNSSTSNFVQTTLLKCDNLGNNCTIIGSSKMNNQVAPQQAFGVNVKLVAGEKVRIAVLQTNSDGAGRIVEGVDANDNIPTFFSGQLVK